MARIRTIKPEFWRDESLSLLDPEAVLLAIGLLNVADDEGYFNANPKLIEADIFPLRELSSTCPVLVQHLSEIGYIKLFDGDDGKKYGLVTNFSKHQVISKKKPSKIKGMDKFRCESGTSPVRVHAGKERKGREGNKNVVDETNKDDKESNIKKTAQEEIVFDFWKDTLNHPKSKLDDKRKAIIKKSLSIGFTVDDLKQAIVGCSKTPHNMGGNDNGAIYDGLHIIMKDANQIERFMGNGNTNNSKSNGNKTI